MDNDSSRRRGTEPAGPAASRRQFARTAPAYLASAIHARGEDLDWIAELAGTPPAGPVLDVATGAGHTAVRLAKSGARVSATDLTEEMLTVARRNARESGVEVRFTMAEAANQPFDDGEFGLVTCRIAAHHFPDIRAFAAEAARLLRPGGRLILVDNIAPADPRLDAWMNRIERLRDPSHHRAYTVAEWIRTLADAGLDPLSLHRWWRAKDAEDWFRRAQTPPAVVSEIARCLQGASSRIREYLGAVFDDEGHLLSLRHESALIVAMKPMR